MDKFILISVSDLETLIEGVMHRVLTESNTGTNQVNDGPLTVQQASVYLNIPVSTLYQYTCKRLIPHDKVGRRLIFYKDHLDSWVKSNSRPTVQEIQADSFILKNKHPVNNRQETLSRGSKQH